jgi:hypothetical protein
VAETGEDRVRATDRRLVAAHEIIDPELRRLVDVTVPVDVTVTVIVIAFGRPIGRRHDASSAARFDIHSAVARRIFAPS